MLCDQLLPFRPEILPAIFFILLPAFSFLLDGESVSLTRGGAEAHLQGLESLWLELSQHGQEAQPPDDHRGSGDFNH